MNDRINDSCSRLYEKGKKWTLERGKIYCWGEITAILPSDKKSLTQGYLSLSVFAIVGQLCHWSASNVRRVHTVSVTFTAFTTRFTTTDSWSRHSWTTLYMILSDVCWQRSFVMPFLLCFLLFWSSTREMPGYVAMLLAFILLYGYFFVCTDDAVPRSLDQSWRPGAFCRTGSSA